MSDEVVITFDIETLDLRPTGVILSLGICMFNIARTNTFEELLEQGCNIYFDQTQQTDNNRSVSEATRNWWESQGDDAKECLDNSNKLDCEKLHVYLAAFYKKMGYLPNPKSTRWFSRGYFDAAFIDNFCLTFRIDTPYRFWTWRDSRSYLDGAGIGSNNEKLDKPENMVPHNSMHDACFEALMMQQLYKRGKNNE